MCCRATKIDTGDTAWMLVATALVLMMTRALGLFYAGLVRAEEHAQHLHDVRRRPGGRHARVGGPSLLAGLLGRQRVHRRVRPPVPQGRRLRAPRGLTIPHLLFFAYHATFCILTSALVSARSSSGCASRPTSCSSSCGRRSCTPCSRTGSGAAAGCRRAYAGLRRRRARRDGVRVLRARRGDGRRPAQGLRPPPSCPTTRCSSCSELAVLWFGWFGFNGGSGLSTGNDEHPGVHQLAARAGGDAGRLVPPRPAAQQPRHPRSARRRRSSSAASPSRPAAGYISPMWSISPGPVGGGAQLTPSSCGGRARAWTRPSTCSPRTATAGLVGILFIGFFAQKRGTASPTAFSTATPRSSATRRWRSPRPRRSRSARRSSPAGARDGHAAAGERAGGVHRPRHRRARRGGLRQRRGARSSSPPRTAGARRSRSPTRPERQSARPTRTTT